MNKACSDSGQRFAGKDKVRLRCHFSVIFESLWQLWIVIFLMAVNQIDNVVKVIDSIGEKGFEYFLKEGGFWGILAILAVTLLVFGLQFFRWRKTYITIEDNLIIIERNTLKKYKNTIAMENISAVNTEKNLFERLVGTCRIKMDTNSMTTADKTDVSIVFREDTALWFRKVALERMNAVKNGASPCSETAVSEERKIEPLSSGAMKDRDVLRCDTGDILKHWLYTLPLFSLLVVLSGIGVSAWYISRNGFDSFIREALGGFLAVAAMVLGSLYNLVKRFFTYYDFTVYRDGKDLRVRYGLLKLRSYTIPVDKITALQIEQPVISRIFRKYNAKVVTVGVGDEDGESSNMTASLSAEEMTYWLKKLVPEYVWGDMLEVEKEEKIGVKVRAFKSIKWHVIFAVTALCLLSFTELPAAVSVGGPILADLFILSLYVLSHRACGYMIREEGMVLSSGYFTKRYHVFKYGSMQTVSMNYHPIAKKAGCGDGSVSLLNSSADIPYIKEELALEISDRMIGGRK